LGISIQAIPLLKEAIIMAKKSKLFAGIVFLFQVFWKYQRRALLYLALFCLISGVLPFAAIIIPKFILDELLSTRNVPTIVTLISVLLGCTFFGNSLLNILNTKFTIGRIRCSQFFFASLFFDMYESDLEHVESASFLDLYGRSIKFLNPDDGSGFGGVLRKVTTIISQAITLAGIIAVISILNPLVVLVFVALTLVNAAFNSRVKKLNIQYHLESAELDRRCGYTESLFYDRRFAKEIRVNTLGQWFTNIAESFFERFMKYHTKTNYNNLNSQLFSNAASLIQQGIAYAYLVYSVLNGRFGIGSFTMYLAAIASFSGAMFSLMNSVVDIRRFSDYYDALELFTNVPKRQREGKLRPAGAGTPPVFEFKNVSFKYPGQDAYTLRNINVTLNAGEKVSVVGENGAGKTTFTKLLMRLYRPTEGRILLNGVDINDYDFDEYEGLFSVVFQDFALYSMPLRDNVANGRKIEDERVRDALERSGFGERLRALEKGLDTAVYKDMDASGFEPSGGEGQKIAMARALLKDGRVVILDEPTAALDPRAEYEIYMNFNGMVRGKTAVFISHRLASVKFCDRTLVFKNGEIAESGTHEELMAKRGLYHELFTMQAQFYEREQSVEAH
jgi:ATP-binding cassette subfamily B protein/ATP-binding cassette subfamily C protein